MGRIEYWLLGAVGALIIFIAVESAKSSLQPRRYALQVQQSGHPRDVDQSVSASVSDTSSAAEATPAPASVDVHSAVFTSPGSRLTIPVFARRALKLIAGEPRMALTIGIWCSPPG